MADPTSSLWSLLLQSLQHHAHEHSTVQEGGTKKTFRQLLQGVQNAAAHLLAVLQTSTTSSHVPLVGLLLPQSIDYVTMVLACLSLRVVFMPVDPAWPPAHTLSVLEASRPNLLVVHHASLQQLPAQLVCPVIPVAHLIRSTDDSAHAAHAAHAAGSSRTSTVSAAWPDSPYCYVMFTSGSTGTPLGVCGTATGLAARIAWMQHAYPTRPGDYVAVKTAVSFVDHLWEMLGPLVGGASLVLLPLSLLLTPALLARELAESRISHFVTVPSVLKSLVSHLLHQHQAGRLTALRVLVSSGELLSAQLCQQLLDATPATCAVLNLYGSTEVAADCTCFDARAAQQQAADHAPGDLHVPAGLPLGGMCVMILPSPDITPASHNAQQNIVSLDAEPSGSPGCVTPLPWGQMGEVGVAGPGVASGYLNDTQLSTARFPCLRVQPEHLSRVLCSQQAPAGPAADTRSQLISPAGTRVFRTRDLGYITSPGGQLVVVGRLDHQIKIGGVRVDLLAVEATLIQHPVVEQAAVCMLPPRLLQAFNTLEPDQTQPGSHQREDAAVAGIAGASAVNQEPEILTVFLVLKPAAPGRESATLHMVNPVGALATQLSPSRPVTMQLRAWVLAHLPAAALPQAFVVVPALPRNPAGKVMRPALPGLLSQAGSASSAALPARNQRHNAHTVAMQPRQSLGGDQPTPAAGSRPAVIPETHVMRVVVSVLGHLALEAAEDYITSAGMTSLQAVAVASALGTEPLLVLAARSVRQLTILLNSPQPPGSNTSDDPPGESGVALVHTAGVDDAGGADTVGAAGPAVKRRRRLRALVAPVPVAEPPAQLPNNGPFDFVEVHGSPGCSHMHSRAAGFEQLASQHVHNASPWYARVCSGSSQLHAAWRQPLGRCIDAPPLIVLAGGAVQGQGQQEGLHLVLACSHAGDLAAYDMKTGACCWQRQLPDRLEAGMCLAHTAGADGLSQSYIIALTGGGAAVCLDLASGQLLGQAQLGGEPKAPPALEPFGRCDVVWCTSHGKQLVGLQGPSGQELARVDLPAACSTPAVFSRMHHLVLCTCLDGSITCWSRGLHMSGDQHQDLLQYAWASYESRAPVFSAAVVNDVVGVVVVAHVDGTVEGVNVLTGAQVWHTHVEGHVFADLRLIKLPAVSPAPAAEPPEGVLIATHAGLVACLSVHSGQVLWQCRTGHGRIAAAPTVLHVMGGGTEQQQHTQQLQPAAACEHVDRADSASARPCVGLMVLVASCRGVISVMHVTQHKGATDYEVEMIHEAELPDSEANEPRAYLGCRDDNLYCLTIT